MGVDKSKRNRQMYLFFAIYQAKGIGAIVFPLPVEYNGGTMFSGSFFKSKLILRIFGGISCLIN